MLRFTPNSAAGNQPKGLTPAEDQQPLGQTSKSLDNGLSVRRQQPASHPPRKRFNPKLGAPASPHTQPTSAPSPKDVGALVDKLAPDHGAPIERLRSNDLSHKSKLERASLAKDALNGMAQLFNPAAVDNFQLYSLNDGQMKALTGFMDTIPKLDRHVRHDLDQQMKATALVEATVQAVGDQLTPAQADTLAASAAELAVQVGSHTHKQSFSANFSAAWNKNVTQTSDETSFMAIPFTLAKRMFREGKTSSRAIALMSTLLKKAKPEEVSDTTFAKAIKVIVNNPTGAKAGPLVDQLAGLATDQQRHQLVLALQSVGALKLLKA
jgi:hypothetical protein